MLKNLKRASAIMLSLAMAVQFGLADTYYANTLSEEPIIEETQEQEPVTVEEGSQQVAVEQTEAPAIDAKEEFVQVPETKSVTLSYVAEDGTILQDATTHEYEMGYSLNSDASVMLNFDGYTLKDVVMNDSQIVAAAQANLNVTSDLTSVKFVYQKVMTESHPEANEAQEENKTEEKTEEDAEANPEAKEELPEYPAFNMSATAGNVTVHVTAAEGVLPSGAQLIVKRVTRKAILNAVEETVTEKDKEVDSAIALDITIVNADGIEIQPNGIVNVSFENVAVGGEEVNVYHVTDDASTVTEVATNTQSFDANHFSIYVITGEKKVELTTFNFVAEGNTVSTQIVKTGDTLITPTAPDIAGKAFVEWQENGSKFDGFGVQTITKTEARTITAKYEDALYVYFYNPEGTQIMRTEKVADHNSHDYSHVSYDVNATHKLVGWAADQNGTTNIAKNITVPEGSTSVNVYAIIKEGYWVTFDSDGGSAIDSQFVFDKISLNDQTTPTKPGYTFIGWYNGTEIVENGSAVTTPMTLKAHWKATKVSYTVIHWWENADDDEYSFQESENKTGLTGTEANAKAKSYEGFTAQPVTKKTIKGDGSTIVSVYYKRNIYKVEFFDVRGRTQYKDLTIEAKYGQDISKQWPTKYESSSWLTRPNGSTFQANIATMPLYGAKFYGPKTGYGTETASYYVQVLPGETGTVKMDGIQYKLDHKDASPGSYYSTTTVTEEDQYPLKGYAFNKGPSTKIGQRYDGAKFYYTRNSYDLKFINNGKQEKTVSKKYEQSISSENYTPTRPSALPEYYVFDGWYENELCEGEAFNFTGKKMPAQNVTLYAKWTASDVKFTYNLNNPEGTVDKDTKKVEAGTVASTVLPSIPTINEYSFAGWYYVDGNGNITSEVFNTNNTITRDTSIVGKWLYIGELRVVYDPGTEKDVTVPTDDRVYAGGARVTVAGNATTTSGKKFLGWELNGNVYKPGQSFEVNKDIANKDNQIILTATWGNAETSTTLTYNPGNGIGTATRVDVMNNEAVEIEAHNSLGFKAPVEAGNEYYFAGWADSKTGNATYADGQTINIDANGENVLYAVWVEKTEITLVANSGTRTYNGAEQSIEGFESTTMNGYTVSGLTAVTKGTNVGEYINTVFDGTAKVEKDGVDVTDKVVVKTRTGKLVITPKSITPDGPNTPEDKKTGIQVTKPKDTMYNGEEQKNKPTVEDTKTGATLVENVDYTLSYTAAVDAGTVEVTITGKGNYTGTAKTSYEITKRNVTLTSATDSKVYDKNPLTKKEVTVSGDGFVKEEGATYNVTGSQTSVGESDNEFTYTLKSNTKAKNYNITTHNGKLKVTAEASEVTVVITGRNGTFPYDGTEKSVKGYDVSITQGSTYTEADFTFSGNDEVKGTEAGTYNMGLKPEDFTNNNTNYSSVTFVVNDGSLVINPKSIIPDGPDTPDEKKTGIEVTDPEGSIYDGLPHVNPLKVTDTKTGKELEENKDYTLTYVGDVVNVGTVKVKVKGIGNYTGEFTKKYQITPREYTVTTDSAEKPYDGTALTAGGRVNNLVDGETVTLKITGSQTEVGSSNNTYSLTWDGSAKEKNYTHGTDSIGLLTVTPKSIIPSDTNGIEVTKPADSKYDGKVHENKPTVKDNKTDKTLVEGTDYTLSYNGDTTNVGTVTVTITGIGNYTGSHDVTYQITKRTVKLTSGSDSKTYDGTPLVKHDVTVSEDGFADVEGATYSYTGTQTDAGSSENTFTYALNEGTLASNYEITTANGTLTVEAVKTEVKVEITGYTDTVTYDGQVHSVSGYDVTNISNKLYSDTAISFTGTAVVSRIVAGTSYMGLTAAQFSNTSANFTNVTFVVHDGWLKIDPKSIIPDGPDTPDEKKTGIEVTKPADSKYDGNVHENKPVVKDTKTGATLVEGTDYTLSYKGDTTNAGTVTVTITGAGNYTGSHNVEYQITKRNVTLTSATASKVYDKTPLTNSNITIGGDGFAKLEGASYNVTGSQTNVGDSNNEFTYKLNDDTKASNYNIEVKFGKLYITTQDGQVIVVITGHKKTYDYDGTEKTVSGYDVSITEGSTYAEADFTFNGNAEVKATAANTYPMGLKVSDFTNNNTNYSSVTFVVNDGSLVINPKSIIPDGPNTPDEKKTGIEVTNPEDSIYDGLPHVNPLTVTDTKTGAALVRDTDYTLTYSSDVINVGTVEINVKGIGNYTGEFTKTYKITPKEYTVTTDSAKKVYDGTALTAGGKIEGIVDGEVVVVHTTGSQTEVGSTPNTYKLEWKKASSKNYKLKEDSIGTLTVTEQTIDPGKDPDKPNPNYSGVTINNPSNSVYDGKEHKWSPAVTDKEGNALVEGTDYTVEYSTSDFRNVTGTITVTISGIGNYTGTVTRTYEITPKAYTVTTESAKKVYDGTALTAGGKIEGIVDGETVEFTTTGSRTVEGTSKNTYSLKWNGSAIQTNYKLAKESIGDLTVTPKSIIPDEPNTPDDKKTGITVSNPKDSKYDGQEHREVLTVKDTKTGKDLIANKDYTVVYSDDLVNAGTVTIKVSGLGNYSGSFTKTYKITKRLVTLTSATVSKTYDGQALTNTSITVSGDGFVEGEGASYEVTGTQTKVGNSANAFEYKLNENTLASNYDITKVVGTLTITAAPAPVTPPTSPTPVSPPPVTPRYIQQVVPALTPQEEVKKEKTPKAEPKEEKVEKEKTPKARPEKFWALINLICAIVTVLFGLLLLISKRHKNKDDEEDDETKDQTTTNEDEEKEQEKKRGLFTRVLAVLIAIVSVVFFLVTEDMSLRWTWTDQWTIWMVVIGFVQIVVFFVGRKWKNVDDDEDEEAQQA